MIVKMLFGSHLYGTDTIDSDKDYKSIYMPDFDRIILNNFKRNITKNTGNGAGKNTNQDVDHEIFSLHEFFRLAKQGQTVALDMLHSPNAIETSWVWQEIRKNRSIFYSKDSSAFLGYAQRQAAKYGVKGSRLRSAKNFTECVLGNGDKRLSEFWDDIPIDDHCSHIGNDPNGSRQVQVCGKIFNERTHADYVSEPMLKFLDEYGKRARQAEKNEGVDWKAMSHALRAGYQLHEMITIKDIIFPLKKAQHITDVKQGKIHYKSVAEELEDLIDQIKMMLKKSDLPEKVNTKKADVLLHDLIIDYYGVILDDNPIQ